MTAPRVLVNGRPASSIDAMDRGLHYGDGLFETIAVQRGRPRLLPAHLDRLRLGCARLGIEAPAAQDIEAEVRRAAGSADAVVKVIVTRGPAGRGYRAPREAAPTRLVAAFDRAAPSAAEAHEGLRVRLCHTRLGRNPALAGIKHLCRLEQVLARSEWQDESIAEGLMLDERDVVVCGTQSNLFAVLDGRLLTPRLDRCGVAGVMRRAVLEWAAASGLDAAEEEIDLSRLARAEEMFLTNALAGARPVRELEGRPVPQGTLTVRFMQWLARA